MSINKLTSSINYRYHEFLFTVISVLELMCLRFIGVRCGKGVAFRGWCHIYLKPKSQIQIGNNCRFNSNRYTNHIGLNHPCAISTEEEGAILTIGNDCGFSSVSVNCFESITIGNNVRVGANCVIADSDFHLNDPRVGGAKPIVICDNVWLGYGVIVMKGVTIGKNSVIGMNSVVTHDIPENVVAAGNPCKVIKEFSEDVVKELEQLAL